MNQNKKGMANIFAKSMLLAASKHTTPNESVKSIPINVLPIVDLEVSVPSQSQSHTEKQEEQKGLTGQKLEDQVSQNQVNNNNNGSAAA